MAKNMSYRDRFMQKVSITDGHWMWQGATDRKGYGHFQLNGRVVGAHRAAMLLFRTTDGLLPEYLLVCHVCDIKTCVNPDHLFLGTAKDNMQDAKRKGRLCKPWQHARGERVNTAKLREADVFRIKYRVARGDDLMSIAGDFGVQRPAIYKIATGRSWRHVPGPPP